MLFSRSFRLLLINAVFVTTLSSCVTSEVWFAPTANPANQLPETHGIVTLVIIDASPTPLPFNHVTLAPKDVNTSADIKPVRLTSISSAPNHSTIFFSSLPAGEYSLSNIRGFYSNGERWYSRWAESADPIGTFIINPGEVTDLGRIILYPKVQADLYQNFLVRVPSSQALPSVPESLHIPSVDFSQPNRWEQDDLDSERQAQYVNIVQNPITYNEKYYSSAGNFYMVGKLGFVLKRDANGNWSNDAVDTDFDLTAVYENKQQALFVGGEYGTLFTKEVGGEWIDISLPEDMKIDSIAEYQGGSVVVLAHSTKEAKIFSYTPENENRWTPLARLDPSLGWFKHESERFFPLKSSKSGPKKRPRMITSVSLIEFNGEHYLSSRLHVGSHYSHIAQTTRFLHKVNSEFTKFTSITSFNKSVDSIIDAGHTYLGIDVPGFWKSWSTYYLYNNESKDWSKISTKVQLCDHINHKHFKCEKNKNAGWSIDFLSVPIFFDQKNAYAIVKFDHESLDGMDKKYIAIRSNDGGQTWTYQDTPIPNENCIETLPEIPNKIIVYCHGRSTDFYESNDYGKTWEHVREAVRF